MIENDFSSSEGRVSMDTIDAFLDTWIAAERDADVDKLDTLLTDDFVGVGPLGFALPEPAWLARHQAGDLTYEAFDIDERQTRVHGDAALVTGGKSRVAPARATRRTSSCAPPSRWSATRDSGTWPAFT
jgi:ketosteroid isomerase-like protein